MSLTLYGAILSPFVRKIRIQLAEQNIAHELVTQPPFKQPDWYYEISPLGRIPALKDDDFSLADSSVIAQYLQDTRGGASLYGSTPQEAARVRWLEKYADYELGALATLTVFRNRVVKPVMGEACDEAAIQRALETGLPPLLDYLETQLDNGRYFLGEQFSMADIAVCCQLINLAHASELIDEETWPGLSSLLSRVTARSSVSTLLPAEHQLVAKMTGRV
ncbi:glutathione S-transferase [Halopseudomonas litoralis]|uniref:Glutathione S-transferase n=1 Tax=Halopseudomonas litoralis TaxID=797277 RepID=A0A1H1SCD7_9GAMM|nr:glutathione S-transferase family protein [Halopseudomonas litoralis]SDS45644.1 glutathione S-transferase [Halopseudomonas litoralis]